MPLSKKIMIIMYDTCFKKTFYFALKPCFTD